MLVSYVLLVLLLNMLLLRKKCQTCIEKTYASLVVSIILAALPYGILPLMSFFGRWHFPALLPETWTFQHWGSFLHSQGAVGASFLLSLGIATCTATLASTGGLLVIQGGKLFVIPAGRIVFSLLPVTMSPVLFATILLFYFQVAGLAGTLAGVILAQMLIALPLPSYIFIHSGVSGYSGLSSWCHTWKHSCAYIPVYHLACSQAILLVCFFQTFIISWLEYGLTSVIGTGQIQTLTLKVFLYIQESNPSMAALSATLLILPPAILLFGTGVLF